MGLFGGDRRNRLVLNRPRNSSNNNSINKRPRSRLVCHRPALLLCLPLLVLLWLNRSLDPVFPTLGTPILLEPDALSYTRGRPLPVTLEPDTAPNLALFYNIYIHPTDAKHIHAAREILLEQLQQVGNSPLLRHHSNVTLFYSVIGGALNPALMTEVCAPQGLHCVLLRHEPEGHEGLTLDRLHDFCLQNPHQTVLYLHTKGSFHLEDLLGGQHQWRRHMTAAITQRECWQPPKDTCNVCGLVFQPIPGEHFPGNMFAAQCHYVRRLPQPSTLLAQREALYQEVQPKLERNGSFVSTMCNFEATNTFGRDRYSLEYWIGMHPTLVPCDMATEANMDVWKEPGDLTGNFRWGLAPKRPIEDKGWVFHIYCPMPDALWKELDLRLREYFLLPGHLYRWMKEVGEFPPDDSWIWKWFPDGAYWKKSIAERGDKALDAFAKDLPRAR